MRIVDVTKENEGYFFNCALNSAELVEGSEYMTRKAYTVDYQEQGIKLMLDEDNTVVGRLHYAPIEKSPLVGEDILVILCLYVHMYKQNIGDKRKKGYGKALLDYVERIAIKEGYGGIAVWAMDWDWNPVSFYLHNGYEESDRIDRVVAAWKKLEAGANPPKLARIPEKYFKPLHDDKVCIVLADNRWCSCNHRIRAALDAIIGIEDKVDLRIVDDHRPGGYIHLGYAGGIFIDGEPYHPYTHVGKINDLRELIVNKYNEKQKPS